MALTREQRQEARAFFTANELAPPYDHELDELQKILAEQPTQPPAGDAQMVERMLDAFNDSDNGSGGKLPTIRERMAAVAAIARDGYVRLEDVEKAYKAAMRCDHPEHVVDLLWNNFRNNLAKPAEQTDEQKVEAILKDWIEYSQDYSVPRRKIAAEIVAALRTNRDAELIKDGSVGLGGKN